MIVSLLMVQYFLITRSLSRSESVEDFAAACSHTLSIGLIIYAPTFSACRDKVSPAQNRQMV